MNFKSLPEALARLFIKEAKTFNDKIDVISKTCPSRAVRILKESPIKEPV